MRALVIIESYGKVSPWKRIARSMGGQMRILSTGGHLCRFPSGLHPLGIRMAEGRAVDVLRSSSTKATSDLVKYLDEAPPEEMILIATDDDAEGDVIAMDLVRQIVDHDRELLGRVLRIRPSTITREAVEQSIKQAEKHEAGLGDIAERAVPGRARAITDRWLGATWSRLAGTGCGRIRAALLGTALCWGGARDLIRSLPQTGEVTFQARSSSGGIPFTAHVALTGPASPRLSTLAKKFAGRLIPGYVTPMASLSAAVAPRFGLVEPFNTGEALIYAARFHNIPVKAAMRGLQDAYMAGRISYPKTRNRHLSEASADRVLQVARNCGINDTRRERAMQLKPAENASGHEGLHPTPEPNRDSLKHLRMLVRTAGIKPVDPESRDQVRELMVAIVARRAIEACRPGELEPGSWHVREDANLTAEDIDLLEGLEWNRTVGTIPPWSQFKATALRLWPVESILIEGMMIEDIAQPSTFAAHASAAVASGQIKAPAAGRLPIPSGEGRRILKQLPKGAWSPELCRMIDRSLSEEQAGEANEADLFKRIRGRMDAWLFSITEEAPHLYEPLVSELRRSPESTTDLNWEKVSHIRIETDLDALDEPYEAPEDDLLEGVPEAAIS